MSDPGVWTLTLSLDPRRTNGDFIDGCAACVLAKSTAAAARRPRQCCAPILWRDSGIWRQAPPGCASSACSTSCPDALRSGGERYNISIIQLSMSKTRHRNKSACYESNPLQSTRFKSTTRPRNELLLRFKSNCTATSDGGAQKLGNDLWHEFAFIKTKVCSQNGRK